MIFPGAMQDLTIIDWVSFLKSFCTRNLGHDPEYQDMTHSQMLGKFEYTGGPIFKVVLEC